MAARLTLQPEPAHIVGDLLQSLIVEKQVRSMRDKITVAKLPLAKDIEKPGVSGTSISDGLGRELATGCCIADPQCRPDQRHNNREDLSR